MEIFKLGEEMEGATDAAPERDRVSVSLSDPLSDYPPVLNSRFTLRLQALPL